MGRRISRGTKEYDELQETRHENRRLKRTISQLRKQISRLDLDRYHNLSELIEKHDREEKDIKLKDHKRAVEKIWECWKCREDILRLVIIERRDGTHYFRRCKNCHHRTKMKPMNDDVDKDTAEPTVRRKK